MMELTAEQLRFLDSPADRLADDPDFQEAVGELREYMEAAKYEGGFLTTTIAARIGSVSQARMDQLHSSRFEGYRFLGRKFIGCNEFKRWLVEPKSVGGRGHKLKQ